MGGAVPWRVDLHTRNIVALDIENVDLHRVVFHNPSLVSPKKSDCSEYNEDGSISSCASIIMNGGLPDMLGKGSQVFFKQK
jgi:hypothetical protein